MLLSMSLIILISLLFSYLTYLIKLPRLIGFLLAGILLGPYVFNLIDENILMNAPDLRQIALVVILIRAGLSLDLADLKKIGRPAVLLSFVPAMLEILAITFIAPILFGMSYLDAAILGSIVAAVSPAVIVPRMIHLIHHQKGQDKKVPHLILAGASIDDVFVIVVFSVLMQVKLGGSASMINFLFIPTSIILGALLGVAIGMMLVWFFAKYHIRDTIKVLIIFSLGFLCIVLENYMKPFMNISGLVSIISIGITLLTKYPVLARRLVGKFEKIWVIAEIMLFVLVGAVLNLATTKDSGLLAIVLILSALCIRILGVWISLFKTKYSKREKAFVSISYIPKATVQAAIGSIPLSLGLLSGQLILSISIVAILVTAPLGAYLIDITYKKLL